MTKTTNFNLNKPGQTDPLRVADFNENADILDAALSGCARVECGTYTGTGTYGEENPSTLTFGIEPKMVFIFNTSEYGAFTYAGNSKMCFGERNQVFYSGGSVFRTSGNSTVYYTYYTLSGNSLTWYNTLSKWQQMNSETYTYGYIAIG